MRATVASAKCQQRCRHLYRNNGKDATAITTTMPVQQQWRSNHDKGNDASKCNEDKDNSATRAKTPAQGWQRRQCNEGKDTSKTIAKTPAQQWHIRRRMAPHITFCEVSHQRLRFLKCPSSCPIITWDHHCPPPCAPRGHHPPVPER